MAAVQGFDRYCKINRLLWGVGSSAHYEKESSGTIFVDLWHGNIQYLLRSLVVSKYLQRVRPARLVGLIGQPGVVTRSCGTLDLNFIERLARSFGVDDIVHIRSATSADFSHADHLLDSIEPFGDSVSPALLRERLANLTVDDGFPIGRFVYDTTLRSELRPTIERIDVRLRHWTADSLHTYRWVQELTRNNPRMPLTFVTGHLDYNPWGLTGEVVRREGGEVLWFRSETNVPLIRIGANTPGTLNAEYHRVETEWFESRIWPLRRELAACVQEFMDQGSSGVLHRRWTGVGTVALPAAAAAAAAAALRCSYGWKQTDVVAGIFAHALSDQPLADEQVYADRFQWLLETIEFAACHPERCWVVKLHPRDAEYDATGSTGELMRRFGRLSHIRFISAPVMTGLMEVLCDYAVTLFGAPGLEFAVTGRPVIVAGRGPYAGSGFVHLALDRTSYEALLLADLAYLKPGPDQVERARLYAYVARIIGAPSSPLLDPIDTVPTEGFWELAATRLHHHVPVCDDLQEVVRQLIHDGEHRATNPKLERFCRTHEVALGATTAVLPLLGSEPLQFCAGGEGVEGLLKGFAVPDTFGVWATEAAVVIGFRIGVPPVDDSMQFSLGVRSLGSEPNWPWLTASVFAQDCCLVKGVSLAGVHVVEIDVPVNVIMEDGTVILAILIDDLRAPATVGLNEDTRLLGIGLNYIKFNPLFKTIEDSIE